MAYIGKTPITGNFVKLDASSVVNGQASYTMNNGGSAFTDYENVNQFLVSLNGILQAPTDSFTVSGSTITFASNLSTGDVIDFIIVLGNTLDIGTPSDSTVTQAKTNFVSTSSSAGLQIKGDGTTDGTLQLNCSQNSHGIKLKSPSHASAQSYTLTFPTTSPATDKFLKTDSSGNLSFADAGGGYIKLAETNVTSSTANVSLDGSFSSDYDMYRVYWYNVIPVTNNQTLFFRFNQSGSAVSSNSYKFLVQGGYNSAGGSITEDRATHSSSAEGQVQTSKHGVGEENSGGGSNGYLDIFNPLSTDHQKWATGHTCDPLNDETYVAHYKVTTRFESTSALSGITYFFGSGNIESGTFCLYGLSK